MACARILLALKEEATEEENITQRERGRNIFGNCCDVSVVWLSSTWQCLQPRLLALSFDRFAPQLLHDSVAQCQSRLLLWRLDKSLYPCILTPRRLKMLVSAALNNHFFYFLSSASFKLSPNAIARDIHVSSDVEVLPSSSEKIIKIGS